MDNSKKKKQRASSHLALSSARTTSVPDSLPVEKEPLIHIVALNKLSSPKNEKIITKKAHFKKKYTFSNKRTNLVKEMPLTDYKVIDKVESKIRLSETKQYLEINKIHHGRSEKLMGQIESGSVALSFWSPPYFVGKNYEKDETYETWQNMLRLVIHHHSKALKPGGFMVVNIGDIRCFKDENIPRFQAMNPSMHKSKVTKEMVLDAKVKFPQFSRYQLADYLGCSEQTIDRRVNGNNIRGGKHEIQTRLKLVGGPLQDYGLECGLYLYDHRIWVKDPAWANCKWTSNSLKSVDEYEDLYVFWKPGQQIIDRTRLATQEWREWGSRAVWYVKSVRANNDHEAKFPQELASRVIRLYTDKHEIVLDPFMGSGTTAIAAIRNGRRFIGIEKETEYIRLAQLNIEKEFNQLRLDI